MSDWNELFTQEGRPYYFNKVTQVTQWQKPKELLGNTNEINYSWILHPDDGWVIGTVTADYGQGKFTAKTIEGQSFEGKWPKGTEPIPITSVEALKTIHLINDLVKLEQIDEPTIAHSLKERAKNEKIYTSVGNILISVNPFERLPLYTATVMEKYRTNDTDKLEPHVFTIAKKCFTEVLENRGNQAVLISGESGSGKTEATKVVLQYLAECAGSPTGIEQQILRCNPILEAFGNAKTLRNNNSSRFGKWMEIHFDQKMVICGCKIVNYLLEKSRVVFQAQNERNYHIFYMLVRGANTEQKKKYNIKSVSQFKYLNQSGCETADGIDDDKEWHIMLEAFDALHFSKEEQTNIFDTVAGVLHLGNIEFQKSGKNGETSTVSNKEELDIAAKLLGLPPPKLAKELTTRVFQSQNRSSFYEVPLDVPNAIATKDSLAKYIYGKLFDWLVGRINDFLSKGIQGTTRMIGVLDIFGFEIFENNSFEQFCINYANEKLQQHFNQHTFKLEEEVYNTEGIQFEHVNFIDNQIVLDLIEKKPTGLLVALDEEIRMPKGSDDTWLAKMHKAHAGSERYQKPIKGITHFNIKHYAGDVLYDATGFLEKNNDTLFDGLLLLIKLSTAPQMKELFPQTQTPTQEKNAPISKNKVQEVKKITLGGQFKQQLQNLMDVLNSTEPHYIRCIKPNSDKRPVRVSFNGSMSLAQLRYSGVMEAVAIRQKGYPFRFQHSDFIFRFQCVNKMAVINEKDKKKACMILLNEMKADLKQIQVGKTMILYKGQQNLELELKRNLAIEKLIKKVQALYKGYRTRCMYERLKPIREELRKAIKLRQIDPLKKAIATADSEDFKLRDCVLAKNLLEKILEEIRLTEQMKELIKKCQNTPEKHVDELKNVVERANKIEMDTPEVKEVKKICETVVWRLEIAESLTRSIRDGDEVKLREALEKAKKIGLDPERPELKDAYIELERITKENELIGNLRVALSLPPEGESDLAFTGPYIAEGITISEEGNYKGYITYTKESMVNLVEAVDNAAVFNIKKAESKHILQLGEDILKMREGLIQDQWDIVEQIVSKHQGVNGIQTPEIAASFCQLCLRAKIGEVEEQIDNAIKNFDREALAVGLQKAQNFDLDIDLEKQFLAKLIELQNLLAEATNESDPQKLNMAIYQCQEFGYHLDHLWDYKQAVEKYTLVSKLIEDVNNEISYMNGKEPLEQLRERGRELGFKGEEMNEIDNLLRLAPEEFIKRQMKAAINHGDNKRKIQLSIQLKELFFARFSNQFTLNNYSFLKSPEEYAKSKLLKKQKWMDEMMLWTKKPIASTLTQLKDQELSKTAQQLFKNLLGLMGDKPINYPDQAAKEILIAGQKEEGLRSELYVHIVKQLTNNENPESSSKGIKFLKCLLQSFPPGSDFENFFEVWLKSETKLPKHMVEEYRELLHEIVNNELPTTVPDTSMF